MTDYKRGTVAMVSVPDTNRDDRFLAVKFKRNRWMVQFADKDYSVPESNLHGITPLVTLEATRKDADMLEGIGHWFDGGNHSVKPGPGQALPVLYRLRDAIRAQTPPAEPPPTIASKVVAEWDIRAIVIDEIRKHEIRQGRKRMATS